MEILKYAILSIPYPRLRAEITSGSQLLRPHPGDNVAS